jgi:predicted DNA-binding protein
MVKRIAVSMPESMFEEMERLRKRAGKDRSAWLQEAVAEHVRRAKREADVAAYVRGYERFPEGEDEDLRSFVEAALQAGPVYDDEWPEAPR